MRWASGVEVLRRCRSIPRRVLSGNELTDELARAVKDKRVGRDKLVVEGLFSYTQVSVYEEGDRVVACCEARIPLVSLALLALAVLIPSFFAEWGVSEAAALMWAFLTHASFHGVFSSMDSVLIEKLSKQVAE